MLAPRHKAAKRTAKVMKDATMKRLPSRFRKRSVLFVACMTWTKLINTSKYPTAKRKTSENTQALFVAEGNCESSCHLALSRYNAVVQSW